MRQIVRRTGVVVAITFAGPVLAQGPFADTPRGHWASAAVNELASRGIFTGYPDGTFGGQRALTRYEFSVASQRAHQDAVRRLDADPAAPGARPAAGGLTREQIEQRLDERLRNVPSREEVDRLHQDVDQLHRMMAQLQETAATLRGEIDRLKQQVGVIGERLPSRGLNPRSKGSP